MSATKSFSIGDVLTAADLNSNWSKLPYATYQFTYSYTSGPIIPDSTVTFAVVYPTARFSVTPIVTVSTSSQMMTGFISSIGAGTVTVGLRNNGNANSSNTVVVYGLAAQWSNGSASG